MSKLIVISGGSDGLGKAIATRLAPTNKVVLLSPTREKLEQVAQELQCEYEVCDISDYGQVTDAVNKIVEKHKTIDCLINNAGLYVIGELDTNDASQIKKVVDVNTTGTMFLTKAVIPVMKQQKNGLIINIISQGGLYGKAERTVYYASKFAITGFTKSLQPELAKYGIGVTGMYPGLLRTKLFEKSGMARNLENAIDVDDVAKVIEFILTFDNKTIFPEIGIKNINN